MAGMTNRTAWACGAAAFLGLIACGAAAGLAGGNGHNADGTFLVRVNSDDSVREVYRELGYEFDMAASQPVWDELQQDCFLRGSRRFGNIPRPIKFLGLAYHRDDPARELKTVCHALRPYDDQRARELCESIGRPLIENYLMDFSMLCGVSGTLPQPATDSTGRELGDWP
jgi:hypothetical protein